jgi:hypothetical protein
MNIYVYVHTHCFSITELIKSKSSTADMVVPVYNPSTWEAKARGLQPRLLYIEFEAQLSHLALSKNKQTTQMK